MNKAWEKWTALTKKFAYYFANFVLAIVYVLFIIPLGMILQTFSKKTLLGHHYSKRDNTYWIKRKKNKHDIPFAKSQ